MTALSGISSGSTGTTIDVPTVVSQLMQAEQTPLTRLNTQAASYKAELTAFSSLQGAASSFQSAMAGLANASQYLSLSATTSDSSVATATADATATAGSYSLAVTALAQKQKLIASGMASLSSAIGTGTLSFDVGTISGTLNTMTGKYDPGATFTSAGGTPKTVTIDSSNNTLAGIRDAINAAGVGVTATIINDGSASPYRLILTSDTSGAAGSLRISGGDAGLSGFLGQDPSGTQTLAERVTAQNAEFTVDGTLISKASNTVSDVIPGIALNLARQTQTDSPITLSVTRGTSSAQAAAQNFVDAYNSLGRSLNSLTGYNSTTGTGGPLQGDYTANAIGTTVRRILSTALEGAGTYTTLSSVGIEFQKDGTLALDSAKFKSALAASPSDVASVFTQTGHSSDSLISYVGAASTTKPGSYAVNVTRIATRGTTVGSAAVGSLTIDGTNDTLQVTLDGASATVTLAHQTYASTDALAQEVQASINAASAFSTAGHAVTVSAAGGILTVSSNRYGADSSAAITGNGADNLLGTAPSSATGLDVAGSIGGVAGVGSGQTLSGATGGDADGLQLLVSGGSTGSRGTIDVCRGYAYQLNQFLTDFLDSTSGALVARTNGINATITNIGKQEDQVSARLALIQQKYTQQFTALDVMLSSMNSTQTFLTQQLNSLPGFFTSYSKG